MTHTPTVLFSETHERGHTTQQLLPISIITDSATISTIPGSCISGSEVLQIANLVQQLACMEHNKVKQVAVIGPNSELAAKMLLNMSMDYVVSTLAPSYEQKQDMDSYVNCPNLFKSYFFDDALVPNNLDLMVGEYDYVVYTTLESYQSTNPSRLRRGPQVAFTVPSSDELLNPFDVHSAFCQSVLIDRINTLTSTAGKFFTVIGQVK